MHLLILDNYDSFTFNLYQAFGQISKNLHIEVVRSNQISMTEIQQSKFDKIVISPGPGSPEDKSYFGVCGEVLTEISQKIPTLGVCLGMQGLCHFYGGKVVRAKTPMHGKISQIEHNGKGIFQNLPQNIEVMRYHSLVADKASLPDCLEVSATTEDDEIMGLNHTKFPIYGIQFHPESFATQGGVQILKNFVNI